MKVHTGTEYIIKEREIKMKKNNYIKFPKSYQTVLTSGSLTFITQTLNLSIHTFYRGRRACQAAARRACQAARTSRRGGSLGEARESRRRGAFPNDARAFVFKGGPPKHTICNAFP